MGVLAVTFGSSSISLHRPPLSGGRGIPEAAAAGIEAVMTTDRAGAMDSVPAGARARPASAAATSVSHGPRSSRRHASEAASFRGSLRISDIGHWFPMPSPGSVQQISEASGAFTAFTPCMRTNACASGFMSSRPGIVPTTLSHR